MEDMKTQASTTVIIERKAIQPHLIIQALAFTVILYFCVGQTPPEQSTTMFSVFGRSATLSTTVGNSVLQHTSQQSGLPTSALRIVQAKAQTWSDSCLGLGNSGSSCTQMSVPGWRVTVAGAQRRWIYRTDSSGSLIKLEGSTPSPDKGNEVAIASGKIVQDTGLR